MKQNMHCTYLGSDQQVCPHCFFLIEDDDDIEFKHLIIVTSSNYTGRMNYRIYLDMEDWGKARRGRKDPNYIDITEDEYMAEDFEENLLKYYIKETQK